MHRGHRDHRGAWPAWCSLSWLSMPGFFIHLINILLYYQVYMVLYAGNGPARGRADFLVQETGEQATGRIRNKPRMCVSGYGVSVLVKGTGARRAMLGQVVWSRKASPRR